MANGSCSQPQIALEQNCGYVFGKGKLTKKQFEQLQKIYTCEQCLDRSHCEGYDVQENCEDTIICEGFRLDRKVKVKVNLV